MLTCLFFLVTFLLSGGWRKQEGEMNERHFQEERGREVAKM
jgi:hypothetical protein